LSFQGGLLIVSALAWLSYVGNGIAYGDLLGVQGREKDLAEIGKHAMRGLLIAGCAEASAIAMVWWRLSDPDASPTRRVVFGLMLAFLVAVGTYLVVRGI
jgi:hypothetical protein